ncbi:MAG: VanZ family protein [bacterium]|nr:VanZ family protein [bacterium]
MSDERTIGQRFFCFILFCCYLAALIYFLFFSESLGRTFSERTYHYNLIPFHEIKRFYTYAHRLGFGAVCLNLAGNVLAFVPFGTFLPLLIKKCQNLMRTLLLGFEFSLLVEVLQLLSKVGSFDVDDLLLNTLGVLIGYIVFLIMEGCRKKKRKKKR